jgi:hypothetical protein
VRLLYASGPEAGRREGCTAPPLPLLHGWMLCASMCLSGLRG